MFDQWSRRILSCLSREEDTAEKEKENDEILRQKKRQKALAIEGWMRQHAC